MLCVGQCWYIREDGYRESRVCWTGVTLCFLEEDALCMHGTRLAGRCVGYCRRGFFRL